MPPQNLAPISNQFNPQPKSNKLVWIIIILVGVLLVWGGYYYQYNQKQNMDNKYQDESFILPEKIIEIDGNKEFEEGGPVNLSRICKQGGFDILSYAGKKIIEKSSLAVGVTYKGDTPIIYKMYFNDKIICEYYAIPLMAPGVLPINSPEVVNISGNLIQNEEEKSKEIDSKIKKEEILGIWTDTIENIDITENEIRYLENEIRHLEVVYKYTFSNGHMKIQYDGREANYIVKMPSIDILVLEDIETKEKTEFGRVYE